MAVRAQRLMLKHFNRLRIGMLLTKAGEGISVRVATFRNFLWGSRELSTMLGEVVAAAG